MRLPERVMPEAFTASVWSVNFVDRQYVTDALIAAEAEVNEQGWDKPQMLALLCRTPLDKPGFAMIPNRYLDAFDLDDSGDTGAALWFMAEYLIKPGNAKRVRELLDGTPNLIGIACINEAWMTSRPPAERDGRIADLPAEQRQEIRMVNAVDLLGRTYYLWRPRGEELRNAADDKTLTGITGRVPEAMRIILLACARQMPGYELAALKLSNLNLLAETRRPSFR